jgi:branched-chain amino acid transport system permease protein
MPRDSEAAPTEETPVADASGADAAAIADVRPPKMRRKDALLIPIVLAGIALYFNFGEALPVPGSFGKVDLRSGQVNFNVWIWLSAIVIGFYFVFGLAGRFAFSTAAMVGLGAYSSAYFTRSGNNWVVGLIGAAVVAGVVAYLFARLVRRAHHFYFAVATLGLAEILLVVFRQWERLSGKSSGEITNVADPSLFGFEFDTRYRQFYLLLAFLGIVLVVGYFLERSPIRRNAIASRDNEMVAKTLGVKAEGVGIAMFTFGSVIAGVAGSLFVHTRGFAEPNTFGIDLGLGIFVMLIIGGLHSMWGALIGAWVYTYIPLYLERWEEWTQVIWGLVLLFVVIVFPEGLVGIWNRMIGRGPSGRSLRTRIQDLFDGIIPPKDNTT